MADISAYFRSRRDQFHKSTYQRIWRGNPFRGVVPMGAFPMEEGSSPTIVTYTHELPSAYPTLTAVSVSNGSGNPACNPTSSTIKRGQTERTFSLGATSFKSDVFCLSDMKRAHQAAEAVGAFERGMKEYVNVWWSDYYRLQNIAMLDAKCSTIGASVTEATSTLGNHTQITALPDAELDWPALRELYWDLVRRGIADENAIGTSNGKPVLPLYCSPEYIEKLFHADDVVREEVKYFDAKQNLSVLGINESVYGFVPVPDIFPIRYGKASTGIATKADLVAANMIYPTENVAATIGYKNQNNALWKPLGNGTGLAEYEVATILLKGAYETLFEPSSPSAFAGMNFKPTEYTAEWSFINQQTFQGDNDRGNLGYYLADIRVGAKSVWPDLGKSILTKVIGSGS
jgi:hypothetical protein